MSEDRSAKLRLAVVTSTFPFGTPEAFLDAELRMLARLGSDLTLFPAFARSCKLRGSSLPAQVIRFGLLSPKTLFYAALTALHHPVGAMDSLVLLLRTKCSWYVKAKNLLLWPTGLAIAFEVQRRGINHIHAYWLSGPSTVALVASHLSGVPWSYTGHSWDIFLAGNLVALKAAGAAFGRAISENARHGIMEQARNQDINGHVEVIHLGVHVPNWAGNQTKTSPDSDVLRILCPAFLYHFKGHFYLIEALRLVADAGVKFHCFLAGDGHLRNAIRRQIDSLSLSDHVTMGGVIPHAELLGWMRDGTFDIVVMASVDLEGIPVALMEAMAAGIPCVATNVGAIPELIDPNCGVLVEPRNPSALAQAIISIARDPKKRSELGENARSKVVRDFNAESCARQFFDLLLSAGRLARTEKVARSEGAVPLSIDHLSLER
jgi:colanic acid/amylovoran biosynthesis glycosyltransferase